MPDARHAIGIAALAATSLVLSGCAPSSPPPGPDGPSGLAAYLEQEIDWADCEGSDLECAVVEVPIDYDEPDGARAQIALTRLPASGESEGSLLINPGGPGGSGTAFVAANLELFQASPVAERFDIVGFDPRGIGSSTPALDCYTDEEYDAGEVPRFGAVYDITGADAAEELADRCIDGSGGVETLVNAGSVDVVRDMDVLREVLGDERLTYLGYSYGSELGAMYASAHPDRVRALVLDGAVDPELTASELRLSQFASSQARFDDLAALCASTPDCVLGADSEVASTRLREIVEPLIETPAPTSDGRELSIWDAYLGITAGLSAEAKWADTIAALAALDAGRADELLALRDSYYGRTADGAYATDLDTSIAVRCMDWPRLSAAEQTDLARRVGEVAPIFDLPILTGGEYHSECAAWPEPPTRDEPWLDPEVDGLPEALVVSVTGDPATPHTGGIALARALDASLLTVDGKQHGAFLIGGSPCVDDAVAAYLLDLETPAAGARCSL